MKVDSDYGNWFKTHSKKYFIPLTVGCIIANALSPLGIIDVIFGTCATILALVGVMFSKNLIVASIFPVIFNGIIVSLEICYLEGSFTWPTFWLNCGTVALGEFVCVTIIGVVLFTLLRKNKGFMSLICANQNIKDLDIKENE